MFVQKIYHYKNIKYNDNIFIRTITKLGKLALKTLLSGNPLPQRSQVIKDVGPDAFDYGLLIGHEDFRLIGDETADIYVTFPHRIIQEFLGAFYFIMMLSEGQSIESLLLKNCINYIFRTSPKSCTDQQLKEYTRIHVKCKKFLKFRFPWNNQF